MKFTVSKDVEIVLNGKKFLIEKDDVIVVEGFSKENTRSNYKMDLIDPYLKEFKLKMNISKLPIKLIDNYISWLQKRKPGLIENFDDKKDELSNIRTFKRILMDLVSSGSIE